MYTLEYIWIDGRYNLRSKTRCLKLTSMENIPEWNYDGSSCYLAPTNDSEIVLIPVFYCVDPFRKEINNAYLVLCESYHINGNPVLTNNRYHANQIFNTKEVFDEKPMFGLEQEYILYDSNNDRPLGWPLGGEDPEPQGRYYCSVGSHNDYGRKIAEMHLHLCLYSGIDISGINQEVMPSQWEYQIGPVVGINCADQLWISRYILHRVCELYNIYVSFNPKPYENWNGSGCHMNYSTISTLKDHGYYTIQKYIEKMEKKHHSDIIYYGDNSKRLCGECETPKYNIFSYGVGDRTSSVRIPYSAYNNKKGYLEDRRPAADIDPYVITSTIVKTTIID